MQEASVVERIAFATRNDDFGTRQQMPLSFLRSGDRARIAKVRGKGEVHHHLENLGFVEGADVYVVSEQGGNLIIEIKGTQVALDRSIASKIITC